MTVLFSEPVRQNVQREFPPSSAVGPVSYPPLRQSEAGHKSP